MNNQYNITIDPQIAQDYYGKEYYFDPDSSPKAWEHYSKFYAEAFGQLYDLNNPQFFTSVFNTSIKCGRKPNGTTAWYNYVNIPVANKNRLFAITDKRCIKDSQLGINFYRAQLRLGGETDFNFNDKKGHAPSLKAILDKETNNDLKTKGQELLKKCRKMHHNILNFSLIQSIGNLQGFKGRYCDDRLDRFVFFLKMYYETPEKEKTCIISCASNENREGLIQYLDSFESVYDYCKKVYFIQENSFVDKLCKTGSGILKASSDVIEYMELAQEYWAIKEDYFLQTKCRMCGVRKPPSAYTNEADICDDCMSESDII